MRASELGIAFILTPEEQAILDHSVKYILEKTGVLKMLQRTLTNSIRNYLKDQLPDYMIPSAFVPLSALPLTPNGKIDRRALSQLSVDNYQLSEKDFIAPPEEELLACIWADVLGVERVGIHDNFFKLGGHSLLATQVMSRIRDTFYAELPLRFIFESPTIAGLSEHLSQDLRGDTLPPITPVSRDQPLPLSFVQQEFWFLYQYDGPNANDNLSVALRLEGQLHYEALEQSFQEIVQRHESLRTAFPIVNGTPVVQVSDASHQLPVINLQDLPPEKQDLEVQRLAKEDALRPFDLSKGAFRTTLLQLGAESYVILVNRHHIITDGWSSGIFILELSTLYEAFSICKPSPLPPLPIQYVDFAHWQRQWLKGETLDKRLDYWKQQLADVPALLEMPTEHPRPPVLSIQGASLSGLLLSPDLTAQLKKLSQQTGTTLYMTLLSAFATLLFRYGGQTDIVVGSAIANRPHRQL
jgi:hypothetical protein